MTTYWHGGRPGIQRGAYILPPTITKAPSLSEYGAAGVQLFRWPRQRLTWNLVLGNTANGGLSAPRTENTAAVL